MIYIGIDPGKSGCITAIICNTKGKECFMHDMPLLPEKGIDSLALFWNLNKLKEKDNVYCYIEKVQPMPKQGSVSQVTYGIGYGKLLAVLEILKIPFKEIRPVVWKKEFGLLKRKVDNNDKKVMKKQKKIASVEKVIELFPMLKKEFYTKKGRLLDGRAESLLIAEYCARTYKVKKIKRNK